MSSMVTIPTRVLTHPGIAACTSGALASWLLCLLWSEEQCTDGYVPDVIVDMYADELDAEQLIEHGLWQGVQGGIRILPLYPISQPDTSEALPERDLSRGESRRTSHDTDGSDVP